MNASAQTVDDGNDARMLAALDRLRAEIAVASEKTTGELIRDAATLLADLLRTAVEPEMLTPHLDRVLIAPMREEAEYRHVTEGGAELVLLGGGSVDAERPLFGVAVASGPGMISRKGVRIPTGVHPGDVVVFSRHVGDVVTVAGKSYRLVKAIDIQATIPAGGS